MTSYIDVLPPGTEVFVGPGVALRGKILAVTIREVGVTSYDVSWWDGNTRMNAWLEPGEVKATADYLQPLRIGFITGDGA